MTIKTTLILILSLLVLACSDNGKTSSLNAKELLYNQYAYQTNTPKKALLRGSGQYFNLKDAQGNVVHKGRIWEASYWPLSGDSVSLIDFTALNTEGYYCLYVDDQIICDSINISNNAYTEVAKASLKAFYYNRTAMPLTQEYAGKWAREAGHPDTKVYIHRSAASKEYPEGSEVSSSGGWYDAGDYNKYIVNSSITSYTLLKAYDLAPKYHSNLNVNIPESGGELPDILAETLYNLKWMQTMQDDNDGGVYHKLTSKKFEDFVMPHEAIKKRYLVQKSTSAALDFTATMCAAQRVYQDFETTKSLSKTMLSQAKEAWSWAMKNPSVFYDQPSDISTGAYSDTSLVDEWFWAASELYLSTGDKMYLKYIDENEELLNIPKWDVVNTLGIISLITSQAANEFTHLSELFISYVDNLIILQENTPYIVGLDKFEWGSNSDVANQAMLKSVAYHITKNNRYLNSANEDYNYIMGRNATSYCFVSGFGKKSPQYIHHRPSAADNIKEPIPGFLIGGPNTIVLDDCGSEVKRSHFPALSYIDMECSYSTNEIAINWNAPLVLTTSILDAYEIE